MPNKRLRLKPKYHIRSFVVKALQKTKLNKVAHKLYYSYFHGFNTANKDVLAALEICFDKVLSQEAQQPGDYFEFGLFKGYSFWYAQMLARKRHLNQMRFFGFDSFMGLPKVSGIDSTKDEIFYEGQYSCSKAQVMKNLDSAGVNWDKTYLIEGYFQNTLNDALKHTYDMDIASIVLIDCDLYTSTVDVLNFIESLLAKPTIVMFDDWNCFEEDDNRGQRRAFREFLLTQMNKFSVTELFSYGLYGQVFSVYRK